eukprot:m.43612 g.43612  ORF g.43612 m.43612 type:complete len:528 (+) comp12941_c0_seq1:66-1649(+)
MAGLSVIAIFSTWALVSASSPPNVLFLVSDDMRPEAAILGGKAITPNIDRLASLPGSLIFDRAYVQQAICCPTRSSFLTSRRPDSTKVWDLKTSWRQAGGNFTTLPETFKNNGYWTVGMGKVFHPGFKDDAPYSWSEPYFHATDGGISNNLSGNCFVPLQPPLKDSDLIDGKLALHAVDVLQQAQAQDKPFFVAVGLHRPHLPWNVLQKYYDLYPPSQIHLADHNQPPVNYGPAQQWSWDPESGPRHCGYMRSMSKKSDPAIGEYGLVPDDLALKFRRAYYASVSATDANFGVVLDALNASGHANNTIIVLIGDHGWQLGDLGEFGKKTNFERATRAPFVMHVPPQLQDSFPKLFSGAFPKRTDALVEFTDIMPTLVDLAGLVSMPLCPIQGKDIAYCTEGASLRPILQEPNNSSDFKEAVFMQYAHCMHDEMIWHDACADPAEPKVMGYAVRTRRWRYVEWVGFNKTTFPPTIHWDQLFGTELYDHTTDDTVGNVAESVNLQSQLPAVVAQLSALLHTGWRGVKTA